MQTAHQHEADGPLFRLRTQNEATPGRSNLVRLSRYLRVRGAMEGCNGVQRTAILASTLRQWNRKNYNSSEHGTERIYQQDLVRDSALDQKTSGQITPKRLHPADKA